MSDLATLMRTVRDEEQGAEDEPATAPQPAVPAAALVSLQGGAPMAWHHQALAAISHACRVARLRAEELRKREGMVGGLMRGQPPSIQQQCEYAKSRAWVPRGHDGGIAEMAGVIHHAVIGRAGVAAGDAFSALCARPLRFWPVFLLSCAVAVTVLFAAGDAVAAWWVTAGLLGFTGLLFGAGSGFLALRSRLARRDDREES